MKLKHAIGLLAAATAGVGLGSIQVNLAAERVATCEVAVNKRTLDIVIVLHHESRRAIDLAELRMARRIYDVSGRQQPGWERRFESLTQQLVQINQRALNLNEDMRVLLEEGCDSERSTWLAWQVILMLFTAGLSGLALWLGLRVDAGIRSPAQNSNEDNVGSP